MTKGTLSLRTQSESKLVTSRTRWSVSNWPDWTIAAYSHSNDSNLSLFDMSLTRYEEDLVDNLYDPSLRMTFLCFPSSKIPKAKEWKLIQLATASQQPWFDVPNHKLILISVFPTPWLLFGLAACIRKKSKAVVRVFQRGQQLLKVESQISGNSVKLSILYFSMAYTPQRLMKFLLSSS